MNPELYLEDLRRKPAVLRALADSLRERDPWAFLPSPPRRIVLLGMGSSAYAGAVAAARMRAQGLTAVSELASTDLLPGWGKETLVVAISASGQSRETLDALHRIGTGGVTAALTNVRDSAVTDHCDHAVLMQAEPEAGGVACRSFLHTLVLLMALEAHLRGRSTSGLAALVDLAADATEQLLATEDEWLPRVTRLLDGPHGTHVAAPAHRLSSAQQGALMLREGPRRTAVPCEAGDWAHVDVYLTRNTDYRLLLFAGSRWDDGIVEWTRPRSTTVVAVGGDFPGAAATVRHPHDEVDDVRLLTEVLVPELVAARLWLAQSSHSHRP